MDKFLETHNLPRLKHKEIENLRMITSNETESVILKLPKNKSPEHNDLIGEVYRTFKLELVSIFFKILQKTEEE